MNKLKDKKGDILFLCQFFYPEYVSSATLPFDTAAGLESAGFQVDVICGYPGEYVKAGNVPMKEKIHGISIHRVRYFQPKRNNSIGRLVNYFSFTLMILFRLFSMKGYRYIVVYSNPPLLPYIASLANSLFKTKVFFVCYDVYPEIAIATQSISERGLIARLMRRINAGVFSRLEKVIALSGEMGQFIVKNRYIATDRIEIIPNWFNDTRVHMGDVKNVSAMNAEIADFCSNSYIVSYFGNMGKCQDMDIIVETIRALKNADGIKFLFAGHGCKVSEIREVIKAESIQNARVFEYLHEEDYLDALNKSSCFIVSLKKSLGGLCCPSKTYSYLSTGRPLLIFMDRDSDIVREIEAYNAGFFIGNQEEMVERILELKNNSDTQQMMAKNCKALYRERHRMEYSIQKYCALFGGE